MNFVPPNTFFLKGKGSPIIGSSGVVAPAWVPVGDGQAATFFMDFTTEGTTNHYWYNGIQYAGYAAWLAALGGSYTRASSAYYYASGTGFLTSAGNDVLRLNYTPDGVTNIGALIEGAATNLALWSRDLTQAGTWIVTTMTTALTATGANGVANSATTITAGASPDTILQTPGLASAARCYSVYLRRKTGTGTVKLTLDGTTYGADLSGTLNSSTYTRCIQTGNVVPIIGIQLGTSGDAVDVDFSQLETGSTGPTMPILTTNATATRSADTFTWPLPFTGWSALVGSMLSFQYGALAALQVRSLVYDDGTASNRILTALQPSSGGSALVVATGGVNQALITVVGSNTSPYGLNKVGSAWTANDFAAVVNGGTVAVDTSGTIPAVTRADLGSSGAAPAGTGNFPSIAYWGARISNTALQTLTT